MPTLKSINSKKGTKCQGNSCLRAGFPFFVHNRACDGQAQGGPQNKGRGSLFCSLYLNFNGHKVAGWGDEGFDCL